jgi:hypothetical protein
MQGLGTTPGFTLWSILVVISGVVEGHPMAHRPAVGKTDEPAVSMDRFDFTSWDSILSLPEALRVNFAESKGMSVRDL